MMHFCHEDSFFIFANNADPGEHLGHHCLPEYLFTGIQNEKGLLIGIFHDIVTFQITYLS